MISQICPEIMVAGTDTLSIEPSSQRYFLSLWMICIWKEGEIESQGHLAITNRGNLTFFASYKSERNV